MKKGEAGQIIIDPDASMSALKHEHKYFLDDKAAGYKGFEGVFDPDFRVNTEFNAYKTEIDFLRAEGASEDVIDRLKSNFEVEVNRIKADIGDPVDPVVIDMIEQMKTL